MADWDKSQLLQSVRQRMSEEDLDQRALARQLKMTQGHLSKLLRGKFTRRSRLVRELEAFASRVDTTRAPSQLVQACHRVSRRSPRHMHFVSMVMQFVDEISGPPVNAVGRAPRPRRR